MRTQQTVTGRLVFEGLLVLGGAAGLALFTGSLSVGLEIDWNQAHIVLALLAAGVGAAAVGLGHTAGRLAGNLRASWLIPALALYSLVIVPGTAHLPGQIEDVSSLPPGMLVAYVSVAGLLLASIRPPARWGSRCGWLCALVAAGLDLGLTEAAAAFPGAASTLTSPLPVNLAVLVCWVSVSTAVVVAGYRAASPPLWRVGLGFGIVATAHICRVAVASPPSEPGLVFAALRVLGVLVVLLGMAQLLRRALNLVLDERFTQQEELRLAGLHADKLERAIAERDHELRNGLSGLTGMSQLLDSAESGDPSRPARSAVASELDRLQGMLTRGGRVQVVELFDAARVVRDLVDLWTVAGLTIDATIVSDLAVVGRAATLAQVVTNLLTNCSRHAPGSRIRIIARRKGLFVVVQVSDDGPQSAQGRRPGGDFPGQGLGLRICRRLLEAEGGRLELRPAFAKLPGFTAVVELPVGPDQRQSFGARTAVENGRSSLPAPAGR